MKPRTVRTEAAGAGRRPASRKPARRPGPRDARWSARVTRESDAMDLEPGVFTLRSARAIAASLKRSSESSPRRKTDAFRSAMSMLNFYVNRAGANLSEGRKATLDGAKLELRRLFGKPAARGGRAGAARKAAPAGRASRAGRAARSPRGRRGAG